MARLAALLGPFDHVEGRPVLHGPSRVEALELRVDLDVLVGVEFADLDERRVADRFENSLEWCPHVPP
jgi:hypothetical protein